MMKSFALACLALSSLTAPASAHPAHDTPPPTDHMYDAVGTFLKAETKTRTAEIAYEYNETLGWPAAKMRFAVAREIDLSKFKKSQRVQFMLHQTPAGSMIIVLMCPTTAAAPIAGRCGAAPEMHEGHGGHEGH